MEITLEQVNARLERIEGVLSEIRAGLVGKETLTMDEAVVLTGYKKSFLYKLTSTKAIPHYKRGRKIVFDRDELNAWIKSNKVKSEDEIASDADTYCATHKSK